MATKKETKIETPEVKLKEISLEVIKVGKQASSITVKTKEDYENASVFLTTLVKPRINRVKDLLKFFSEPYVEARRVALEKKQEIEALFGKELTPLEDIEKAIKRQMSDFLLEEDRKARAEEQRLAKIRLEADAKRIAQGKDVIETPIKSVERVETTVKSDIGKTVSKKVWKFKVVNIAMVPREYLRCEVAHSEVMGAISNGIRSIAGLDIYEDFDISASGR